MVGAGEYRGGLRTGVMIPGQPCSRLTARRCAPSSGAMRFQSTAAFSAVSGHCLASVPVSRVHTGSAVSLRQEVHVRRFMRSRHHWAKRRPLPLSAGGKIVLFSRLYQCRPRIWCAVPVRRIRTDGGHDAGLQRQSDGQYQRPPGHPASVCRLPHARLVHQVQRQQYGGRRSIDEPRVGDHELGARNANWWAVLICLPIQSCLAGRCYDGGPSHYMEELIDGLGQNRLGFW